MESLQREAVELEKNAPIMETKLENARQGLEEAAGERPRRRPCAGMRKARW